MIGSQDVEQLERLRCIAPLHVRGVASRYIAGPIPKSFRRQLEAVIERCVPLRHADGYVFPVLANSNAIPIPGGLLVARCVREGAVPLHSRPARAALTDQRLVSHFEELTKHVGHLCLEPGEAFADASLPVRGDSCELALAVAIKAALDGWLPSGRVVLSGRVELHHGALVVKSIGGARDKARLVAVEMPDAVFFVCPNPDEPSSDELNAEVIEEDTPLDEVIRIVREEEQKMNDRTRAREALGVARSSIRTAGVPIALEDALAVRIENDAIPERSFQARLSFELFFEPANLPALMRDGGWQLVAPKEAYSWMGKVSLSSLEGWTTNLIDWTDGEHGRQPAVLTLELNRQKHAKLEGSHEVPGLMLSSIDAVLLPPKIEGGRHRAEVGLIFDGSPCSVKELLSFVGARAELLKMRLRASHDANAVAPTLKGLLAEIEQSLLDGHRMPRIDRIDTAEQRNARSFGFPYVWQTIHATNTVWPEVPSAGEADLLHEVWLLIATVSMPKPGYPKDIERLLEPEKRLSKRTLYGIHDKGTSFLIGSTPDKFNQETKPKITMQTHYLQWLLAREHARVSSSPVRGAEIQATFSEDIHRRYFELCQRRHRRGE